MVYEDTDGSFEKENIYLTVKNMLEKFPKYIKSTYESYYLENPSNRSENFLKKWNDNPELVRAFEQWIRKAKIDIIENPEQFIESDPHKLQKSLCESFGQRDATIALENYGEQIGNYASSGKLKYDMDGAAVVLSEKVGKTYRKHTFFGGDSE